MIHVISIGTDRKVFEEGSAVRERLLKQSALFDELHVIVFCRMEEGFKAQQLGNLWLYPTNSFSRALYIKDSVSLARALIAQRGMNGENSVVTVQDPFECGLAGLLVCRKSNIPLQVQVHTDLLNPEFLRVFWLNRMRVRIARHVLRKASGIRAVSRRVAEAVRTIVPAASTPIVVLPVFARQALESLSEPPSAKLNSRRSPRVLSLGRFAREKDFPVLLRTFAKARERTGHAELLIVGEGPEEGLIMREVKALRLEKDVQYKPWQTKLSSLYREADIVLATSRFEGYGLVLLEAAAHAKPIVSTDVGIIRELIPASYERFICPVGDVECLARALAELIDDEDLRLSYGAALRSQAQQLLIPEDAYGKLYYQSIAGLLRR